MREPLGRQSQGAFSVLGPGVGYVGSRLPLAAASNGAHGGARPRGTLPNRLASRHPPGPCPAPACWQPSSPQPAWFGRATLSSRLVSGQPIPTAMLRTILALLIPAPIALLPFLAFGKGERLEIMEYVWRKGLPFLQRAP